MYYHHRNVYLINMNMENPTVGARRLVSQIDFVSTYLSPNHDTKISRSYSVHERRTSRVSQDVHRDFGPAKMTYSFHVPRLRRRRETSINPGRHPDFHGRTMN